MKILNLMVILILSIGTASAATVSIVPHTQNVNPGDVFTADVVINPEGALVAGWQLDLTFNPAIVSVNGVTEGNFLKQGGATTYYQPGAIDNTLGKVTGVASAITTAGASVSTEGIAATIQMTAKTDPGTSPILLSSVLVGNPAGQSLPVTIDSGEVTVVPEIATIGLMSLGLIGLIGIRRYRK